MNRYQILHFVLAFYPGWLLLIGLAVGGYAVGGWLAALLVPLGVVAAVLFGFGYSCLMDWAEWRGDEIARGSRK